jgi:CRISPR-associated protein Cas1
VCAHQTKQSLVYDLQEPFRWIADVAVMEAFESGRLDLPDFYFTGCDYRYHLEPEAKEGSLGLLRERFNSGVTYKGRSFKWNIVIEQNTVELGHFLIGRLSHSDFLEPRPSLPRTADRELSRRVLDLTESDAEKLGIGKSRLHYLRMSARGGRPLKMHLKTRTRLAPLL